MFFPLGLSLLILSLPLLGLGFKSTSLIPGFCVHRPRQYYSICWEFDFFQDFLFLLGWLFGQMESIDVAGVFQEAGMLTYGPAQYPKCMLNVSSFLTIPHPLECLRVSWSLCRYWKWWEDERVGGWFIYVRDCVRETGVGCHIFYIFCSILCCCELLFHGWYMIVVASVSFFLFCFLCLWFF